MTYKMSFQIDLTEIKQLDVEASYAVKSKFFCHVFSTNICSNLLKFLTFFELLAWFKIVIFVFLRAISQHNFFTKEEEKNATIGLDVLIVNLQLLFYV